MRALIVMAVLLVGLMSGVAWTDQPIVDPEYQKTWEQLQKESEECRSKEKKPIKKMECGDRVYRKYQEKGVLRGTQEYCEKHYAEMPFDDLKAVLTKILKLKDSARIITTSGVAVPGELDFNTLKNEELWIKLHLGEMQKAQRAEKRRQLFKE